jgi:hypothetical protein
MNCLVDTPRLLTFKDISLQAPDGIGKGLSPKWFELMSDFSKKKGKVADFFGSTNDLLVLIWSEGAYFHRAR